MEKKNTLPAGRQVTINDLAVMVQKGFDGNDKRFNAIDEKLEKIENLIIIDHKKRIEKLEIEVKELKNLFAA